MIGLRFLPTLPTVLLLFPLLAFAAAPAGETWLTIATPHFRVHHTGPLEPYARSFARSLEVALPKIEQRLRWQAPVPIDIVVMDPSDAANGFAVNFPNTHIEVFAAPFASDSSLAYYTDWVNELATHELTHIVANDTTLGLYRNLRSVFGSWVKPNGLQPTWLSEGLAVYEETSLTPGGRGRSPFTEAILREAVLQNKLNDPSYTSLDRFNDGAPWWPAGNTPYLLGYAVQAIPSRDDPSLPGKVSYENAGNIIWSPNGAIEAVAGGQDWAQIWSGATGRLSKRYAISAGESLPCRLTESGGHTGGHALSSDGWIYFSEESWHHGYHLARIRADASCGQAKVERLYYKRFSGPTQVAVSENGSKVAFAEFDQDYEHFFGDIHVWDRDSRSEKSITHQGRARDPAFLEGETLAYVRTNADTSESIVRYDLATHAETVLFTGRPFERISGLYGRGARLLFSLHDNQGHEKIHELASSGGAPLPLLPRVHEEREFERNPFLAADGTIVFAGAYGHGPQEIYRFDPLTKTATRVLASRSGYLDRPLLLSDGTTLLVQDYGLRGLDLARAHLPEQPTPAPDLHEDLHEYLTGEAPPLPPPPSVEGDFPPSVPYSATRTTATSLWPQYWLPQIEIATDGALLGANTSGNDPLEYHRYFVSLQADTRANFPTYRAFYRNRVYRTTFHFEASQSNSYFRSTQLSNLTATQSAEAILPLGDIVFALGAAHRERRLFGVKSDNILLFQNLRYDRSGQTPSAIAPNFGKSFNVFAAAFPNTRNEKLFVDIRPELQAFTRGIHPSHSISLAAHLGITSNSLLASNYYVGGGPSTLSPSEFVVRGYAPDTLFGQRIATLNIAYTLPLAHPYRGSGTRPYFFRNFGLRFNADAGSSNFMASYSGKNFNHYERHHLGSQKIYGLGLDLLTNGSIFYHVPISVITGLHYGPVKRYGGGWLFFLGLGFGLGLDGLANPVLAQGNH